LLGDILSQEGTQNILDSSALESSVKKAYQKRLSTLKTRTKRAATYSTISIFATKILSLLLLSVILSKILPEENQSIQMLIADVLIPTALIFLMVSSIKPPSAKNMNIVVLETAKIIYKRENHDVYEIKMKRKKSFIMRITLSLMYVASACVSFGGIYYGFHYFGFPFSSIIINMIFIALILFAGTALAKRAQELTIEDEKESFLSFIADMLLLPIQGLGQWLSNKWKKYNAFTAIFNALIDMPFSTFVEFLEKWRYFIKERKEEIR
jgi:hypothetical protein